MEHLEAAGSSLTDDELGLLKTARTHSFAAPAATPPPRRFPVLLFSHGEEMNAFLYSNFHEELASHGYVVIAVDHPGAALFAAYTDGAVVSCSEAGQNLRRRVADRTVDLGFVRDLNPEAGDWRSTARGARLGADWGVWTFKRRHSRSTAVPATAGSSRPDSLDTAPPSIGLAEVESGS
jgi:hypothetical protein